jgi:hypothetical protein
MVGLKRKIFLQEDAEGCQLEGREEKDAARSVGRKRKRKRKSEK